VTSLNSKNQDTLPEYEVSQNSGPITRYRPVKLNPSKSDPTLAIILQGEYSFPNVEIQCINAPLPSAISPTPLLKHSPCANLRPQEANPQENNLVKIIERSQENNLVKIIERPQEGNLVKIIRRPQEGNLVKIIRRQEGNLVKIIRNRKATWLK
jgi:hypothetical protein